MGRWVCIGYKKHFLCLILSTQAPLPCKRLFTDLRCHIELVLLRTAGCLQRSRLRKHSPYRVTDQSLGQAGHLHKVTRSDRLKERSILHVLKQLSVHRQHALSILWIDAHRSVGILMTVSTPVSYTHLDVYKRQGTHCASEPQWPGDGHWRQMDHVPRHGRGCP